MSKLHLSILFLAFLLTILKESHGSLTLRHGTKVVGSAMTPFTEDGNINKPMIPKMAKMYANYNITAILIGSYAGEGPLMDLCTRQELIEAWMKAGVPLGLKIMVDITAIAFLDKLKLVKFCARIGVTAIFVLPEVTYKAITKNEVMEELDAIYNVAPNLSIIFHDLKFLTTPIVNSIEVYKEASLKIPSFDGIATDYDTAVELYRICGPIKDKSIIVIGNDVNAPLASKIGIHLSVWPSLFPKVVLEIVAAINAGDCKKAAYLQQSKLNPLIKAASGAKGDAVIDYTDKSFIENVKYVYELLYGHDLNQRPPLREVDEAVAAKIKSCLALAIQVG